jgi:serine/threonine protein kinase
MSGTPVLPAGYRVLAQLSSNQALDVYDVFSEERGCRCVAKLVRPDRHDERSRARLVREGEVLLGLTHPHIVRAYELVREPEPVLILETLTGMTLARLLDDFGALAGPELAELGLQLCSAVGYLHRRGWLHLDLKPDNVVAEGGIAKVLDLSLTRPPGHVAGGLGTRQYAAPEQARGGAVGAAADVWGIGAVLHAAATGRAPFAGLGDADERYPQLRLRAPRAAALPAALADVVAACLAPEPAERPTVAALAAALEPLAGAYPAAA